MIEGIDSIKGTPSFTLFLGNEKVQRDMPVGETFTNLSRLILTRQRVKKRLQQVGQYRALG
jgi:hypothetical protein